MFCDNCSLFHFVYVRWRIQDLLHRENIVYHYYIITDCTIAATVNDSNSGGCNVTQNEGSLTSGNGAQRKIRCAMSTRTFKCSFSQVQSVPVSGDGFLK